MFEAAMPTKPNADDRLNAQVARDVVREHAEAVQREAAIVAEACRLTDQLCDVNWLNRGVKHSHEEIAAIAVGYYKELKAVAAAPRQSPDPYVLIDGEPLHFHAEADGFYWNREIPTCPSCGDELSCVASRKLTGVKQDADGNPVEIVCFCLARLAVIR